MLDRERYVNLLEERGIDALIASSPENVIYTSGYCPAHPDRNPHMALVVATNDADCTLIVPKSTEGMVQTQRPWVDNIRYFGKFFVEGVTPTSYKDALEAVIKTLQEKGVSKGRVGFEESHVSWMLFENLKKLLPDASFVDATDVFERLRMVKTSSEIAIIKEAVKITEETFRELINTAREGATEWEIVSAIRRAADKRGAHTNSFDIEAGLRSSYPGFPTHNKLSKGDLLKIDYSIIYKNYPTDLGRQAVVGEPSNEQRRIYNAVLTALDETIDAVESGLRVSDLFHLGVKAVRDAGIPSYQRHHIGHGNGLKVHEEPTLGPNVHYPLEKGMVLCVELPYYKVGWGGIALEDTLLVKDNGCEIFNTSSKELYVV